MPEKLPALVGRVVTHLGYGRGDLIVVGQPVYLRLPTGSIEDEGRRRVYAGGLGPGLDGFEFLDERVARAILFPLPPDGDWASAVTAAIDVAPTLAAHVRARRTLAV